MAHTRIAQRYIERIKSGELTKAQMNKMKSVLTGRTSSAITSDEVLEVMEALESHPVPITGAWAEQGLKYLKRLAQQRESPLEVRHTEIVENFDRFELVAFWEEHNKYCPTFYPVYRVYAKDGANFDYLGVSWQSGKQFEVF